MVGHEAIAHYYDLYHGPYRYFSDSIFTTDAGIDIVKRTVSEMTIDVSALWPDIVRMAEEKFKHI